MKHIIAITLVTLSCSAAAGQDNCLKRVGLTPLVERVNVQADTAKASQIIGGEWVAVGINKEYAISLDGNIPFDGKPSYRFELGADDNTLSGYSEGETKGRAELSYCYATAEDYKGVSSEEYGIRRLAKDVYHAGKGICAQGSSYRYTFSVYVPSGVDFGGSYIFAQWHGMPDRRLAQDPDGKIRTLTDAEFLKVLETTVFKKDTGYEKIPVLDKDGTQKTDKDGFPVFKAGKPNGWLIEQGGYPPLAFGINSGYFYIKANSDRRWLTDKTDRCNAGVSREVMVPVRSEYKSSTIAYKLAAEKFPKDMWVTFDIEIDWTVYGGETEEIVSPGRLDVVMKYKDGRKKVSDHIVDNETIEIGRNDDAGYYFKFGIYRVGGSTVPVAYNLAGFSQEEMKRK